MSRKINSPIYVLKKVERITTNAIRKNVVPKIIVENKKNIVPVPLEPITCLNCNTVHQCRYCPECGQASNVRRFNWKGLFENITKGLLNTDKGFLYTIKMLFIAPGKAIGDYIAGKRVKFFPSFPLMFIIATFYAVVDRIHTLVYSKSDDLIIIQAAKDAANEALSNSQTIDKGAGVDKVVTFDSIFSDNIYLSFVIDTFRNNLGITILVLLPIFVVALRWCFGKKFRKNFNWAESFIMSAFMNTQFFLVLAFLMIIEIFFPGMEDKSSDIAVLCFVVFLAWDMFPLAEFRKKRKAVWRSILTYLLFFFFALIILIVSVILIVYFFGNNFTVH